MGCYSYWFLPKHFLHKSFLLGKTLLSLVQNMVIICLISDVMGVTSLHFVVSFRRPLPSPPEINRFIILYINYIREHTNVKIVNSLLSNIIRLHIFKTRSSSDLLMLTKLLSWMSRLGGMRGMRLSTKREQERKQDHKIINDK